MAMTFTIKHGDTLPKLQATLYEDDALTTPVDLTNASAVKLKVGDGSASLLLDATMTIVDAANGIVEYQFAVGDWATVTPTQHQMEFEVTWVSGDIRSYPLTGYATLQVNADLDP